MLMSLILFYYCYLGNLYEQVRGKHKKKNIVRQKRWMQKCLASTKYFSWTKNVCELTHVRVF